MIVEELVRLGITHFAVAPGSRSTPLVTAIADNPRATSVVHFDERGTAFHVLGHARATGRPAAWVTTSGTALANGYPAVVEASLDSVPMILLTADRPPELRDTGANQTIDQLRFFGNYVRWFFDLPAPDSGIDPQFVLTTVDQAAHRACAAPAGPVQLNCMFREPLAPVEDGVDYRSYLARVARWQRSGLPYTRYEAPRRVPGSAAIDELAAALQPVEQGVVVAGRLPASGDASAIQRLAGALNWPLLADVTSQLRHVPAEKERPIPYHALIASPDFRDALRPNAVLHFGAPVVSKRLMQYLRAAAPERYVVVQDGPFRSDPDHMVSRRFECEVTAFCDALSACISVTGSRWMTRWQSASEAAFAAVERVLGDDESISEPWIARSLPGMLPDDGGLFLGSSMPVRDADAFSFGRNALRIGANRGASGIDGIVSSAAGFCAGSGRATALVIGDLALLHDLNSLGLSRAVEPAHPIIVINNNGGGIFSFLEIAAFDDLFERFFGTPHNLTFDHAAAMFGIPYELPETRNGFEAAVRKALSRGGPTLIEVRTDRDENVALHRAIEQSISRSLSGFAAS